MTQTVKQKVIAEATAGGQPLSARRLFIVFAAHARKTYQYSAVKLKGSEGNTLLGRPETEIVTVDCASLADAFVELLNEVQGDEGAKRVSVGYGGGFATAQGGRCFDTSVVGNIRKPEESWAATGRCVFMEHYFVETGSQTRWYLDPCMFTTYTTKDEAMSWKFEGGGGKFSSIVKRVIGNPEHVLIRVPLTDSAPKPRGFETGHVLFKASDFKKDELSAMKGQRQNPSWSDAKYTSTANAALASINKIMRARAGVNADWSP